MEEDQNSPYNACDGIEYELEYNIIDVDAAKRQQFIFRSNSKLTPLFKVNL